MFCTQCGNRLDEGVRFCTSCGAKVPEAEVAVAVASEPVAEIGTEPLVASEQLVASEPEPAVSAEEAAPITVDSGADTVLIDLGSGEVDSVVSQDISAAETVVIDDAASAAAAFDSVEAAETAVIDDGVATAGVETDSANTAILSSDAAETAVLDTDAFVGNEYSLPDSAFQPTTAMPMLDNTQRAYATGETASFAGVADADTTSNTANAAAKKRRRRNAVIGICSAAAVVVVAAISVLFVLDPFNPNEPINSDAFPNDVIRGAVLEQLDADGDGRLSDEEAAQVTALVFTPEGAKFVLEGNEVNVQEIREHLTTNPTGESGSDTGSGSNSASGSGPNPSAPSSDATPSSDAQADADQGTDTQSDSDLDQEGARTPFGEDLSVFPNLKTLVATDSDLTDIDLSTMPNLEYVDLRQNPDLRAFDLSNNSHIKVLFCDEDTTITGLDDAGLYYTDLITNMQVTGSKYREITISVEYDTHARPISVDSSLNGDMFYTYDEKGRLIREQVADGYWFSDFVYGDNGLLSYADRLVSLDENTSPGAYAYGYDDKGNLIQTLWGRYNEGDTAGVSDMKSVSSADVFSYLDGKLAAYKSSNTSYADSSIVFSIDESGLMKAAVDGDSYSQNTAEFSYTDTDALAKYVASEASLSGTIYATSFDIEYSPTGVPTKVTRNRNNSFNETSFSCNADGYINEIRWGSNDDLMSGCTGTVGYIKRVGSLADRSSERFVPVVYPCLETSRVVGSMRNVPLQDWFITTGDVPDVTMCVSNPFDVAYDHIGIPSYALMGGNELKLAAYDREHWTDGLNLSGEQLVDVAGAAELFAKAAEVPLPTPASAYIDDPVYGGVVKQYLDAAKSINSSWMSDIAKYQSQYPDIPPDVIDNMSYMTDTGGNSDVDVVDFAYVDLNSDGINELVVTFPRYYLLATTSTRNNRGVDIMALYGQVDGKLKFITGNYGQDSYIDVNGNILTNSGTGYYGSVGVYTWNGEQAVKISGFDYEEISSAGEGSYAVNITTESGTETLSNASTTFVYTTIDDMLSADKCARLNWTPIAVNQ